MKKYYTVFLEFMVPKDMKKDMNLCPESYILPLRGEGFPLSICLLLQFSTAHLMTRGH